MNPYTHTGAGCLFTDRKTVLAGWQPKKSPPRVSGIGGKREEGEAPIDTAWRETIEELLGLSDIPPSLLEAIKSSVVPVDRMEKKGYVIFIYSYYMMERALELCAAEFSESPLYPGGMPLTLAELIFHRIAKESEEITTLCLLPVCKGLMIDKYFLKDIEGIENRLPL
jgi:NUDIX domain